MGKFKEIKEIINNKDMLINEFNKKLLIKEELINKQIYYRLTFCFLGIFEFIVPFILLTMLTENFLSSFVLSIIYIIKLYLTDRTFVGSLFKYITKKRLRKKGVDKNYRLYNYLKKYYLSNKDIDKVCEYYKEVNIKDKHLFFEKESFNQYVYSKIVNEINSISIEELKKDKKELSKLIVNADFDELDIKDIKEEIKYALNKDKENKENEILNVFEENEKLEKKLKNRSLLEI